MKNIIVLLAIMFLLGCNKNEGVIRIVTPTIGTTTFTYNGSPQTIAIGLEGVKKGDNVALTTTGTISATNAGTYHFAITGVNHPNYQLSTTKSIAWQILKAQQSSFTFTGDNSIVLNNALSLLTTGGQNRGSLTYQSSHSNIASITVNGVVRPIAIGTTTIIITQAGDNNHHVVSTSFVLTVVEFNAKEEYIDYTYLKQQAVSLAQQYPNIFSSTVTGKSIENRDIILFKISDNVQQIEDEAKVVLLGTYHAREWISPNVVYLIAQELLNNYATDPEIRKLVDNSEIYIIPMVNPDGHEYSTTSTERRYWRKNRRNNGDGTFGVDLNRNHSYNWGYDNSGSSPDTVDDTYRGPTPTSEPETLAVVNLTKKIQPQILISYHSYTELILYPWGYTDMPSPDHASLNLIAREISNKIKEVYGKTYTPQTTHDLYAVNGDVTDWSYGELGIFSFTVELRPKRHTGSDSNTGFSPPNSEILPTFEENFNAISYIIQTAQEIKNL